MKSRSTERKTCLCCHVSKRSSDVCVVMHASLSLCACVSVHWSPVSTLAKRLFPANSKEGGGCISTSLHYTERWGGVGGGGGLRRHLCNKTGSNCNVLPHRHTHTHTRTCTGWHLEKPQCVSMNPFHFFKHITSGTSSVIATDTHITACCQRSQQTLNSKVKLPRCHKLWLLTLFLHCRKTVSSCWGAIFTHWPRWQSLRG